ncbi:amidohydrolase family protein [Tenacibaculum discolor]|uniref:amidohydrolase family protein n=1 Tax=Tenacibaculum discolor TaxID=361581 RepID=UPI000F5A13AC|nr:amidohydrolase family protein [Tenacibaculum discolor]
MKYLKISNLLLLLTVSFLFLNCTKNNKTKIEKENNTYVIKNVNIVPMTENNNVIENAIVVIHNNKIESINDSVPSKATIIDGKDKWLIPGLIDMHVHTLSNGSFSQGYATRGSTVNFDTQNLMTPYIANGVTTIFELSGRLGHFSQRDKIMDKSVIGPRMAIAAVIDGKGNEIKAITPIEGRQSVRNAKGLGYRFIKVYTWLNEETFKAVIDEAEKQNMKVVGHIPTAFEDKPAEDLFVPHFGLIAHAEELSKQTNDFSYEKAQEFAHLAKENNTWLIPNLSNMVWILNQAKSSENIQNLSSLKYVHPLMQSKWLNSNRFSGSSPKLIEFFNKQKDFHKQIVKAFKEEGVPMLAGTDAGISGIVWGFSLHDELELLVEAGLTTEEALASATRLPAEWLEIGDKIGTVETGKFADLILLDKNPLTDINNTRTISGVFVDGKWLDKTKIDTMLLKVAKWNDAHKEKYQWKNRKNL